MADEIITVRIIRYFHGVKTSTRVAQIKKGSIIELQDVGKGWKTTIMIGGAKGEQGNGN